MRVLVAGATGAIGRPLISALLARGHELIGLSSSESGARSLREKGVEGEVANVLDENAVLDLVTRVKPHAVIDELTSLPKRYTPEEMRKAADRDRNVRLVGGGNLHNAARAAGAKRYIVQSTGFFYGPGTYHDPTDGSISQQVRERGYPVIGSGSGVFSFVHVEDAAAATAAALESDPGVYNVVDDDPAEMNVWLPAFARFLGAPEPPRLSQQQALEEAGADAVYYATRLRGAANGLAKRMLGFAPRELEWLSKHKAAAR